MADMLGLALRPLVDAYDVSVTALGSARVLGYNAAWPAPIVHAVHLEPSVLR